MLRRLLTAGLVLAGMLALPGAAQASSTVPPTLAATWGAGWIGRQFDGTGYVAGLGGPSYNTTALGVLALVAAGVGEEQAAKATAYLMAHVDAYVLDGDGKDQPAALAALVLVAHARNLDPATLVARLLATKRTTGDDAGLFGEQDATYDGAFRQSMALLALAAAGQTDADAVAWLEGEQCADGGWMGNRPEAAACPAFDFGTFVGEDSNGTALATQALVALGETPDHDPLEFLAKTQNADGGFAFVPGFDSDANSTALAIQALIAAGEDLVDWETPNGAPEAFLLGLQLGNPPEETAGAFAFQEAKTLVANAFATVQAVPALAGKAFPLAPATLSNDLPLLPPKPVDKPVASPSATPTASPSPTALPTRAARVPELPATGPGRKPWDATGQAVLGLGLVGYGILALGGARLARRR